MNLSHPSTPQTKKTIEALWKLQKIILDSLDYEQVTQKICDGLLQELGYLKLGYRIIVLTLVNKRTGVLERVSVSQTPEAERALKIMNIPFRQVGIPLDDKHNYLIKTIGDKKPRSTHDWYDVLGPVLNKSEAHQLQNAAGIKTSLVFPIVVKDEAIGAVIFSMVKNDAEVSDDENDLLRGFCEIVGLSVENSRLFTSLDRTTKKLKKANEKLKQLDKMKDEFVALASHELRTPLTSIRNYLWMSLNGKKASKLSKKTRYYLGRSYKSTERLISLVNDILNVSRIESGRLVLKVKEENIHTLVLRSVDEVRARAEHVGVTIHVARHADSLATHQEQFPPNVLIDSDKIKEVVINIIGNSLKFTPKGGDIWVSFFYDRNFVTVSIKDSGVGIPKESLHKLFEKFGLIVDSYRGNKDTSQGTGLGLYICKALVEMHGGKIWAESEGINKGSSFSFTVPRYSKKLEKDINQKFEGKKGPGIAKRIQ